MVMKMRIGEFFLSSDQGEFRPGIRKDGRSLKSINKAVLIGLKLGIKKG
jgi:hypothetical protein